MTEEMTDEEFAAIEVKENPTREDMRKVTAALNKTWEELNWALDTLLETQQELRETQQEVLQLIELNDALQTRDWATAKCDELIGMMGAPTMIGMVKGRIPN